MSILTIGTLELGKRLLAAGVPQDRAEALPHRSLVKWMPSVLIAMAGPNFAQEFFRGAT